MMNTPVYYTNECNLLASNLPSVWCDKRLFSAHPTGTGNLHVVTYLTELAQTISHLCGHASCQHRTFACPTARSSWGHRQTSIRCIRHANTHRYLAIAGVIFFACICQIKYRNGQHSFYLIPRIQTATNWTTINAVVICINKGHVQDTNTVLSHRNLESLLTFETQISSRLNR